MDKKLAKLYRRGLLLLQNAKWDEAIEVFTEIIRLEEAPERKAGAYHGRGFACYAKEDYDRALADYDKAIELDPQDATAYRARAGGYHSKGDYDRALADCDKAIELDPQDATAYRARAGGYHSKGDYDRALADCDKAIELDPQDAGAYKIRGRAHYFKGDYDRALADCDKVIELDPQDADEYMVRGWVSLAKGDYGRAIADCDRVLELNPTGASAYNIRGGAYYFKGDYDHALADCDKAIELNPTDTAAYVNRGRVYCSKGDYGRAIADYDRVLELNPTDVSTYMDRGLVYCSKEDYGRALADYDRVLELNPTDAITYNMRVYLAFWLKGITSDRKKRASLFEPYCKLADATQGINTELFCRLTDDEAVAHYTSLHGLRALAERRSPFRLYNSAYMNDREEGQVFFEIMKDEKGIDVEGIFYKSDAESPRSSSAYIGSFVKIKSQDEDERENGKLSLWRTYGKHDNEEAVGACLIFNKDQFARDVPHPTTSFSLLRIFNKDQLAQDVPLMQLNAMSQLQENVAKRGGLTSQNDLPPLYNVIYKREIGKLSKSLKKLTSSLKKVQNLLRRHKEHEKTLIELVRVLLDSIRFLFKTDHYSEEKEVRVIQMSYDTGGKKPPECTVATEQLPPRFYLNIPGNVRFSEVILGPGTHGVSEWQHYLGDGIAVRKSDIKFGKIHQ